MTLNISEDNILKYFSYYPQETICMIYQSQFSGGGGGGWVVGMGGGGGGGGQGKK